MDDYSLKVLALPILCNSNSKFASQRDRPSSGSFLTLFDRATRPSYDLIVADHNRIKTFNRVDATMNVEHTFNLTRNWQGDPCIPTGLLWIGLTCTNNDFPRILSLDLSDNELTSEVPQFLVNLTNLRSLNLARNKFTARSVPKALLQKEKFGRLTLRVDEDQTSCTSLKCHTKSLALLIVSIIIVLLVLSGLIVFLVNYNRRKQIENVKSSVEERLLHSNNREISFSEINKISGNLTTSIGRGGFDTVYLGALSGTTKVAIKLLSESSQQGFDEFKAEAKLLTIVHHRNLVSLLGYCDEAENKALIYEFMPNGNLREHLLDPNTKLKNWIDRLKIPLDVAQGLNYLHNGCMPPIIHRDIKTSNILLNDRMQAKISDFGLSRVFAKDRDTHLFTSHAAGTLGYYDRDVLMGNITKQGDVYAFGVILL